MIGEIINLTRIIDENELVRGYCITVEVSEKPNLHLGKCEVIQKCQ